MTTNTVLTLDFTGVTPVYGGSNRPPQGAHKARIVDATMGVTSSKAKTPGAPQLCNTYQVCEGPHTGTAAKVYFPLPMGPGDKEAGFKTSKFLAATLWGGLVTIEQCSGVQNINTDWFLNQVGVIFIEDAEPDAVTGAHRYNTILVPSDKAAEALAGTWTPNGGSRPAPAGMQGQGAQGMMAAGAFGGAVAAAAQAGGVSQQPAAGAFGAPAGTAQSTTPINPQSAVPNPFFAVG
jgi:hypothetical protein